MNDKEQEPHQDSDQRALIEEEIITTEGFLNHRLSLLRLDHSSMASTDVGADDTESYQVEFTDPSPPRSSSGNNTPLKRRSSSSTFSPSLCRCFSLNYAESRPIQPAEISNRGTLVVPENRTQRSLFPPPVSGSTAAAAQSLPPPHPLARTISDPTRLSCLQEKNPIPKTDPNSPCGLPGLGSGFESTSESSPFKVCSRYKSNEDGRNSIKGGSITMTTDEGNSRMD